MNTKTTIDKGKYVSPQCEELVVTIERGLLTASNEFSTTSIDTYDIDDDSSNWE